MRLGNSLLGVMDSHTGSPRHVLNELPVGLLSSLQSLSFLLTSCENTLTNIGYLSKIENSDSLKKIVYRLPLNLRQKWRDVADTVTERQEREVTFSDVGGFVEEKARVLTHPIFGDISSQPKGKGGLDTRKSTNRRVSSFAADAHNPDHTGEDVSEEIPVRRSSRNRLCARYANLLTGYLNVMISEQEESAKDTNLYERKNFSITVLLPVITPSLVQRRAFARWTGVTTSIQHSYIHLQCKLFTQPSQRQELRAPI